MSYVVIFCRNLTVLKKVFITQKRKLVWLMVGVRKSVCCKELFKEFNTRWMGHVADMWKKINAYRSFVGKPEGKGPHEGSRQRLENNIKI